MPARARWAPARHEGDAPPPRPPDPDSAGARRRLPARRRPGAAGAQRGRAARDRRADHDLHRGSPPVLRQRPVARRLRARLSRRAWQRALARFRRDLAPPGRSLPPGGADARAAVALHAGVRAHRMIILDAPYAALAWLGRQGTRAIAALVFVGIALPPLDALLKPLVTPAIFALLCLAFLRVDPAALRGHLRAPALVLAAAGWIMIALPVLTGLACRALGLEA